MLLSTYRRVHCGMSTHLGTFSRISEVGGAALTFLLEGTFMRAARLFLLVGLVLGLLSLTGGTVAVLCVISLCALRVLWNIGLLLKISQ